ncbi:MAG: hypothetical protein GWO20_07375 [Candidatus Korarchaeota archaeon]|nr:hypothetical protein [Candidatus Korarchaeota archaeon]NIU83268.1 hypothetical protein [Candidatus Thorarchaeota archaeon]NIW13612.1 hypothetical protein [Candidatus Thorarchaeota archaeon]NIW51708.1 hypothetical protein [Candidatus Korarchaeota archaeon]
MDASKIQLTDFHVHSTYSADSNVSIYEIAEYAEHKTLFVVGIADHCSRRSFGTKMLDQSVVIERRRRIKEVDSKTSTYLLNSVECDILPRGRLTFPKGVQKDFFHYVIGSVHSKWDSTTWRDTLKNVISGGKIDVLGHPLAYNAVSWNIMEDIVLELAKANVAVELNQRYSFPPKYFLNLAKQHGVKFVLSSDAHTRSEIGEVGRCVKLIHENALEVINPSRFITCQK